MKVSEVGGKSGEGSEVRAGPHPQAEDGLELPVAPLAPVPTPKLEKQLPTGQGEPCPTNLPCNKFPNKDSLQWVAAPNLG